LTDTTGTPGTGKSKLFEGENKKCPFRRHGCNNHLSLLQQNKSGLPLENCAEGVECADGKKKYFFSGLVMLPIDYGFTIHWLFLIFYMVQARYRELTKVGGVVGFFVWVVA